MTNQDKLEELEIIFDLLLPSVKARLLEEWGMEGLPMEDVFREFSSDLDGALQSFRMYQIDSYHLEISQLKARIAQLEGERNNEK